MVIKKIPFDVMDKLNLFVFLVDSKGVVEEIDWKTMKKLQS